jgi:hypothetical protein
MNIIDRRLNPKGKSLANRQRFLRRARQDIKKAVREATAGRNVGDVARGEKIAIPAEGLNEPSFRHSGRSGVRDIVLPGNKEYMRGDRIAKPPGGAGGGGREGSTSGEGEDDFRFALTKEEFLDIFLDDLELPDMAKKTLRESELAAPVRAGFSVSGSPTNLNLVRTMRNSFARRRALGRPRADEVAALEAALARLDAEGGDADRRAELEARLATLRFRMKRVPYIDPVDVRYNRFEQVPKPSTRAVMFCLMDVSGSMTEHMKDLAKRFFMLLHIFLTRCYRQVDIVFIRHTHEAAEVDEQTFFYSAETGGTVVSSALEEMRRIIASRYSPAEWNIYAAQASDGDNADSDNARALAMLETEILPKCQYFAYIEVNEEGGEGGRESALWRAYSLAAANGLPAMRKVRARGEIFAVFHELFARQPAGRGKPGRDRSAA